MGRRDLIKWGAEDFKKYGADLKTLGADTSKKKRRGLKKWGAEI